MLQSLIEAEDLDRLLELASLDEIAIAWCRYHGTDGSHDDDSDWWAVDLLFTTEIFRRPDLYRELLLKLVDHAEEEGVLGNIGAGPLENFVSDDEDDLRWLEAECRQRPKLRLALSNVWCAGYVTEETLERLDAAAGRRLSRPRPREEWPPALVALDEAKSRLIALAGEDWWSIDRPNPEQTKAIKDYFAAMDNLVGQPEAPDSEAEVNPHG